MLKKLIKHELYATSKSMLYIYMGMILLTLITRFIAIPVLKNDSCGGFLLNAGAGFFIFVFSLGLAALCLAPLVLSAVRFKKNILGSEGYLTMTLPVSTHQLLASRLIINVIWYFLSGIIMLAILLLMLTSIDYLKSFSFDFNGILNEISSYINENPKELARYILIAFEALLLVVSVATLGTMVLYSGFSVGYSVNNHKRLFTAFLIYVFYHIASISGLGILFSISRINFDPFEASDTIASAELFLLIYILMALLKSAVYYLITYYFLSRKLNLE